MSRQDTSEIGFDLFDRWGNLKVEYIEHRVKKGSAVWGAELNEGHILLIEHINVVKDFQRKGYGKKLVEDIWAKAQAIFPQCKFAITRPTWLWSPIRAHFDSLPEEAREPYLEGLQLASDHFWRACGFRRIGISFFFGLAKDPAHPSHTLAAPADPRRRKIHQSLKMSKGQQQPYNEAMVVGDDAMALE
ncbi:MAG: hypothetical protein Q9181_006661 [Wetmoreana brouardii]